MAEEDRELAALLRKANEQLVCSAVAAKEAAQREQVLREEIATRNEELLTVIESIADAVIVCDASGTVTLANRAALEMMGKERGEPIGSFQEVASVLRLRYPDGRLVDEQGMAPSQALRLGKNVTGLERVMTHPKTQQRRFLLSSSAPLHDRQERVVGVVVVATDVTRMRELQERQQEFTSLISHDLRSPLTSILGIGQVTQRTLEKRGLKGEARRIEALVKSAHRMDRMIEDLVDSSRLEAGQLELRKEPVDVISLAVDLAERVGASEDRQRIQVDAPEWVPPVLADASQLERALTNLLINALKYSPVDKPVVVRVSQREGMAEICVADQGVGILDEDLPHVFEHRFRAKTSGKQAGLGLGLYITRLLAEAHGGQVSMESEVGKGSTCCITWPLA